MKKLALFTLLVVLVLAVALLTVGCDDGSAASTPSEENTPSTPSGDVTPSTPQEPDECNHRWGDWSITAATCTQDGVQTRHCLDCDAIDTVALPSLGHSYGAWNTLDPASCTEDGTRVRACAVCGHEDTETIEALGHDPVEDLGIPATCTDAGLTQGSHCSVCLEVLVAQEPIGALGHAYVSVTTSPTCTDRGYTTYTCERCHDEYVDNYTEPSGHTQAIAPQVDATCTEDGLTQGTYCSVCNVWLVPQEAIPASGHAYECTATPATCTERGYTTFTCTECGNEYVDDYTGPLGHTEAIEPQVDPTCTEDGLTQGTYCSACGEWLVPQQVIPASGHNYESAVTPATCTERGYTTYTCSRCGDEYVDDYTDPSGHTETIEPRVDPTCTEGGLTQGTYCSTCGEWLVPQETILALGHAYGEWTTTPATCTQNGERSRTCSRCGDEDTEVLNAPGHDYVDGFCSVCGERKPTEGLQYSSFGTTCVVSGYSGTDENVYIPATYEGMAVKGIRSSAFLNNTTIRSIEFDSACDTFWYIDNYAFYGCSNLAAITIPSVTEIGESAFEMCTGLTSVTFPSDGSLRTIGNYAFRNDFRITTLVIPDSVTTIGAAAFGGLGKLASLTMPFVGGSATVASGEAKYPLGYVFGVNNYTGATKVIQSYRQSNGNWVGGTYYIPTSLTTITLTNCTTIGEYSFQGCTMLTTVTIPAEVTAIYNCAFYDCSGLTDVYFLGTRAQWEDVGKYSQWDQYAGSYTVHCSDDQ